MRICLLSLLFLSILNGQLSFARLHPFYEDSEIVGIHRAEGFVPDSKTAIRIALAILEPIYGKNLIRKEKPFKATLENDVWTVQGTLTSNQLGGVAVVQINKNDGKILKVLHWK